MYTEFGRLNTSVSMTETEDKSGHGCLIRLDDTFGTSHNSEVPVSHSASHPLVLGRGFLLIPFPHP